MPRPTLAARLAEIDELIDSKYPYLAADEARRAVGRGRDPTLGFGITPSKMLMKFLQEAGVTQRDVFFDIGCGPGNCVLAAAQVVRESHGVEVLPKLARLGRAAARELGISNVRFHVKEFQRVNVRKGTLFYCYSTCFDDAVMADLADKLATAPPGARILTVSRGLDHPAFEAIWRKVVNWGRGKGPRTVYLHVRRPLPPKARARKAAGR